MKIVNRKFGRDYEEIETFEAGIVLIGAEVKAIRDKKIILDDSFVKIINDGAYLINANISLLPYSKILTYEPTRSRKLLLHKKELIKIRTKMHSSGLTLAPKSCYNKGPHIKLEIALVKGRKELEKRKREKARDIKLDEKREAKEYLKI